MTSDPKPGRSALAVGAAALLLLGAGPAAAQIARDGSIGPADTSIDFFDPGSGVDTDTFEIALDGEPLTAACDLCGNTATCEIGSLGRGSHRLDLSISDEAGNRSQTSIDLYAVASSFDLFLPATATARRCFRALILSR